MNKKAEPLTKKFLMRVSEKEQIDILRASGKLNSSQYLRKCERFFRSFDPDFMANLQKAADSNSIDVPTLITQLLMTWMATEKAILDVFGSSKVWQRAFQLGPNGLRVGDELSDQVYAEVKEEALGLKKRLEKMKKGKVKQTVVTREEATLMSASL